MIKFKLKEGVPVPKYETEGAAGADVIANSVIKAYKGDIEVVGEKLEKMQKGFIDRGYIKLRAFERVIFGTGITVADMSKDFEIQVRSRSGVAAKKGLLVANSPGTVDSDYRGEIGVILYNSTPFLSKVEFKERIAQIVPKKTNQEEWVISADVIVTERGEGGFGSTGNK